LAVLN